MNVLEFSQSVIYNTLDLFFNRLLIENTYSLGWLIITPKLVKIIAKAVLVRAKSGGSRASKSSKGGDNSESVQSSN